MGKAKETEIGGKVAHISAGAIIERDGRYLLIDRAVPPPGFAGPAGHVDEGETPEEAVRREIKEEVGLDVSETKLVSEEFVEWNECSKGVRGHYWYLYRVVVTGELHRSERETKTAGWYTAEELGALPLEKVWRHWFHKLKIISQ